MDRWMLDIDSGLVSSRRGVLLVYDEYRVMTTSITKCFLSILVDCTSSKGLVEPSKRA
jgi:hypothetical protein